MNKFFHNYPICPNCLAPVIEFTYLKMTDKIKNSFKCDNCGAHFYNRFADDKFRESLFWEISLNDIEKAYISFLNSGINGKFLITWPWDDVKFSPILATEYLLKNPNNKVIIVDKLVKKEDFIFEMPSVDELFDYMYCIDHKLLFTKYDEQLITEDKIFESRKKFYCNISLIEENLLFFKNMSGKNVTFFSDKLRMEVDFEENKLKQFRKDMIEKIERMYTDTAIYSVRIAHENKLPKRMNDYGILKLYFNVDDGIESDVSLQNSFKKSYGSILPNINNMTNVSNEINSISISDELTLKTDLSDYNLIFLDDSMDTSKLMSFISKVDADVVLFNRADLFFERSLIFNKGFEFNNFLKYSNKTVLLFSTFRDNRGLYKIGDDESILNEYAITPHTWDFGEIIDYLKPVEEHLSLGSSNFNCIKSSKNIPIEYIKIDELVSIEESFSSIIEFYKSNPQIRSFLIDLIRTPLWLYGYFRDKKVFRKYNWTFESFFAMIYNRNEELGIELDSIFNSVYKDGEKNTNPIYTAILSLISDFELKKRDKILFVVDSYETKGLKELMELNIGDEELLNHFKYFSWDKLSEFNFNDDENYYIVSTRRPYINFKLNDFDFKKIYFIGSPSVIDDLKVEITKRLTDEGTKPIFVFDENNEKMAPELLIESINQIKHLPKLITSKSNNLNSKLNYHQEPKSKWNVTISSGGSSKNKYNVNLNSDDEAVLVISKYGEGMFLPLNNNIYIKNKSGGVEEIKTSKDTCKDLINKEIVLDSEGFYTSFRLLFFNFVVETENKIPIIYRNFQWNDFKAILKDAFEWLELLKVVFKNHYESNVTSILGPKYLLANDISKLNLNARDPGYIHEFWLCDPLYLETSEGKIPIYEKEHPRSGNDLILLYRWIDETFDDMDLSVDDAERCYYASITLQRIRRDFLRKRKEKIPYSFLNLYYEFEKIADRVLLNADSFEVSHSDVVKLEKEIVPYKVVTDYKEYLK